MRSYTRDSRPCRQFACAHAVGVAVSGAVLSAAPSFAQDYPSKPIRIVTAAAGGGSDSVARIIAQALSPSLGQQVLIENRGGIIQGQTVARAAPDGYTLLLSASIWTTSLLQATPFDPIRDFAPITHAVSSCHVLVVHPSLPVKSVSQLIALAKKRPGHLNYGATNIGTSPYLAAELFKSMAGVNIVAVPYNSSAQAQTDLIGGHTQLMFPAVLGVAPHVKSGRLRALAVTSTERSALAPDLPTVMSTLPGYESVVMSGVFAPAKTPVAAVTRLNQEIVRALARPEVKEKLLVTGVEPVGSSPEQFAAAIKLEIARMSKLIKDAGIRAE